MVLCKWLKWVDTELKFCVSGERETYQALRITPQDIITHTV